VINNNKLQKRLARYRLFQIKTVKNSESMLKQLKLNFLDFEELKIDQTQVNLINKCSVTILCHLPTIFFLCPVLSSRKSLVEAKYHDIRSNYSK
jgi:hypothetical protein